ncbi:hypothetical protein [Caulobacter phage Cr30]|uniref:hypothetical protein n=1 Tax=Caulobacter phage Cr30 TaxID=1357714 RepID=UPI0004A9B84B|nr:hypothetical protein OZ74_gp180 [Caulobacter phage Cr30]AGS81163.1 hypothetical protein [Caulobacter phage Cr30]
MRKFSQLLEDTRNEFLKLEYHDQLSPKLWNSDQTLKEGIKERLIPLAISWMRFAKLPLESIVDITLTGGISNFNWTSLSDIDLHILVDFDKIPITDHEFLHEYIMGKKNEWSHEHDDITVEGFPVEIYAQDIRETTPREQGVYSLTNDQWNVKPKNLHIDYNERFDLVAGVKEFADQIRNVSDLATAKQLKQQIKDMRSQSLKYGSEFSRGNLIFKALRNRGDLLKLKNWIKEHE